MDINDIVMIILLHLVHVVDNEMMILIIIIMILHVVHVDSINRIIIMIMMIISLHLVHVDGQHHLALCLQHDELLQGHVDPAVHAQEHVSVVPGDHFLIDSILFKATMWIFDNNTSRQTSQSSSPPG